MANTTYDQLYEKFSSIAKFSNLSLPSTVEGQYNLIRDGLDIYNSRMDDNLICDNTTETINQELTSQQINLFANCMKLQVINNIYSEFVDTYSMYQKEIGFKDYKSQIDGKLSLITNQENIVNELVFSMKDDYEG